MGRSRATKPTRDQKVQIAAAGLRPADYLVLIDTPNALTLVHHGTGTPRTIKKVPSGGNRKGTK